MEVTMISEQHYMFLIPFWCDVSLCPALRFGLLMFEMHPRLRGSFLMNICYLEFAPCKSHSYGPQRPTPLA